MICHLPGCTRFSALAALRRPRPRLRLLHDQARPLHKIVHRLLERPFSGVQIDIHAMRAPENATAAKFVLAPQSLRIKPGTHQHFFAVQGPTFNKDAV